MPGHEETHELDLGSDAELLVDRLKMGLDGVGRVLGSPRDILERERLSGGGGDTGFRESEVQVGDEPIRRQRREPDFRVRDDYQHRASGAISEGPSPSAGMTSIV